MSYQTDEQQAKSMMSCGHSQWRAPSWLEGNERFKVQKRIPDDRINMPIIFIFSGCPNKQAGWELGISEFTVKAHRAR